MRLVLITATLLSVIAAAQVRAQDSQSLALHAATDLVDRPARLNVVDMPLEAALHALSRRSGVSIAYSQSLLPQVHVTCTCEFLSVGDALDQLIGQLPLQYRELGGQIVVEVARAAAGASEPGGEVHAVRPATPPVNGDVVAAATITGRVTEQGTGRPLVGAQVSVVGTGLGGISDENGRYILLNVPAGAHEVVVTLVGYSEARQAVVVPAEGSITVDFALETHAIALDAVLVTGTAGRQERRAQGATIADLDVGRIAEVAPVQNVSEILQGRIPGVSITQGSGVSGSGTQIRIRGASSISLSNEPLVYIDGVRVDTRTTNVAAGAVVNPLNDLNPNEIESIEVVKGPAAATLYGADASAGVIQVITKRGAAGSSFRQSASIEVGQLEADFSPYSNFAICDQSAIDAGMPICQGATPGTVISDNPFRRYGLPKNGSQRSFAWTARGGGDQYGFFSSLAYDGEEGLFPNSEYERLSARLNYNLLPTDGLRLELNFPIMRVTGDFPVTAGSSRGWTTGGMAGTPLTVGTTTDGWFASNRTPEAIARIEHTLESTRVIPDFKVDYTTGRLRNRLTIGADIGVSEVAQFFPKNDHGWYSATENQGQIQEDRRSLSRITGNYLGVVDFGITGRWTGTLSVGTEVMIEEEDLTWALGNGLTTNAARSVSAAAQVTGGQSVIRDRRVGFYGQFEPSWREVLYLQFGLRADRFAAFGESSPWFYSPSVRASYVISDEGFWNVGWVPSLRLRAAYGTTGRAPQAGVALRTFQAAPYLTGPTGVGSGVVPLNPGNPELHAERGREFEAGFDAGLFDHRLGVEFTFFNKVTTDLLLRVPQPPSLGFVEDPFRNVGEVVNRGVELGITADLVRGDRVNWNIRTGIAALHNEVVDLGGVEPFSTIRFGPINRVTEGRQVGAFFSHRIRRIDTDAGAAVVSDSLEYLGNLLPSLEGNVASTLTLPGGLRLYAQVDFKSDFMLYNATALYRDRNFGVSERSVRRSELPAEERIRHFGPYVTESGEPIGAGSVVEPYIESADFVRLNEVSLSYSLPAALMARLPGVDAGQLTVSARNLKTWTDYSGFNPDIQNEFDAIAGRADFFTLPPARRLSVRLDVTF